MRTWAPWPRLSARSSWNVGPWISETDRTPDLLQEAGFGYVLDWCMDDQPVWLKTRAGRILAVSYPQELNDANAVVLRRASASELDHGKDSCAILTHRRRAAEPRSRASAGPCRAVH